MSLRGAVPCSECVIREGLQKKTDFKRYVFYERLIKALLTYSAHNVSGINRRSADERFLRVIIRPLCWIMFFQKVPFNPTPYISNLLGNCLLLTSAKVLSQWTTRQGPKFSTTIHASWLKFHVAYYGYVHQTFSNSLLLIIYRKFVQYLTSLQSEPRLLNCPSNVAK